MLFGQGVTSGTLGRRVRHARYVPRDVGEGFCGGIMRCSAEPELVMLECGVHEAKLLSEAVYDGRSTTVLKTWPQIRWG